MSHSTIHNVKPSAKIETPGSAGTLATAGTPSTAGEPVTVQQPTVQYGRQQLMSFRGNLPKGKEFAGKDLKKKKKSLFWSDFSNSDSCWTIGITFYM
jgi:hypothetical protein